MSEKIAKTVILWAMWFFSIGGLIIVFDHFSIIESIVVPLPFTTLSVTLTKQIWKRQLKNG